ncbi:acylglycerol kinase family protein [Leuconostoc lactis]|uniref:acylglycerol kinase family protein n=1 Tax=Leuconostoc lactis TaxID=1246 RepID=UPI001F51BF11|nr:acylglycerol kinase family protein [Leuconostoc lactis]
MPNFYVIHNPQAGNQAHGDIISQIKQLRPIARWYDTQYAGHAVKLAKNIASTVTDPEAVVLAIGGDGTLNEVLNGLIQAQRPHPIPLAYIPLGSGNDFARAAHLGTASEALHHLKQTTQGTATECWSHDR